ncbi:protein flightless-1 isoform X2 [Dermacentor albipictus]|uniref:protein flightless-1 isoform X2 n=1 Tax=Dermacentor albipictus TaxID=60249 RepID=UPI0038FC2170
MAATGVLPFVRGIDFTRNDFQWRAWSYDKYEDYFPKAVGDMTGLRWLRLNRTKIDWIPDELQSLKKLETLSLVRNNLVTLHGEVPQLPCLRSLNCRHNRLKNSGIPPDVFDLEDLFVVDLSYNDLREIPTNLEHARGLLVLNLAYNRIETIPHQLFVSLVDLIHLDLSGNQLETLPPQMRRLVSLQTLVLNDNPLGHYQLRQLPALTSLQVLHMRNTQRTVINTPVSLDSSAVLSDVDFSQNALPRIPDVLYTLPTLRRLNLSDNAITEVSPVIGDVWKNIRSLNLSRNKLTSLPAALCRLTTLTHLYLNDNLLDFEGIPSGIGKLHNLVVFMAAYNNLEMIPEGVVRCGRLKKLVLCHNRLITLPEAIHLLTDLEVLDLKDNPDLVMPPKPLECQRGAGAEFYNVDFSLSEQLRLAGATPTAQIPAPTPVKDPIARKMRLRRRREGEADSDQAKILKGMTDVAMEKDRNGRSGGEDRVDSLKPKRWDEALEKPPIDYSEIFEEDVGQMPGTFVWEIDNFLPNPLDESLVGKFHEGDCYIVLKTFIEETQNLNWLIYYWIGAETTLDKKACAAIHAVNLRNFLGAHCRTVREEQADESPEFLQLFGGHINYRKGNRASSGFYNVEEVEYVVRLYRLHSRNRLLHVESVAVDPSSLDPRYVFVLDAGRKLFVWSGRVSQNTMVSKGRLLAEKINKNERKNYSEVITCAQSEEEEDFWNALGCTDPSELEDFEPVEHVPENFAPAHPCLYKVGLGMGYLELPQVEVPEGKLVQSLLDTKNVYILDCNSDLFVWLGKRSTRLVRAAALKLCQELLCMIHRPSHAIVNRCQEGTETMVFKSKFVGWDDVIAVDFTRTAESVARTGADLQKWMSTQKTKTDLSALFMPRQPAMSKEEATQLMEEWNEDLEAMEAFVLEGKKFVKLPEEELGHFYSADCYVFLCRYWVPAEAPGEGDGDEPVVKNGPDGGAGDEDEEMEEEEETVEDDYTCVVYFWQGRDAGNMGWLTFTFSLQKKFEALFGDKLQVLRTHQQQENLKFLSHFKRKFIIHTGSRKKSQTEQNNAVELFHLRANGSPICTRCVQIPPTASNLNSAFCYILKVPFEQDGEEDGMVYVWIGSKADEDDVRLAEELARSLYGAMEYSIVTIDEGEEPENFFWVGLGGKAPYDDEADFLQHARLFRCSNEKGYFAISEKCADFCQDDLADDDIMILDNGAQVFIWVGSRCSEVEVKLAYKSAQVYVQNLRVKQPELPRKLMLTVKGKESKRFTKCFHGWGAYKTVAE